MGSLHESDEQLGLAHFLEHACFLKTKAYEKGDMIKFLESVGLEFGADLNAHTSFSETVYKLHVPIDDPNLSVFDESIKILGEWAHNVIIDDSAIETERNVVGEEHRAGLGLHSRLFHGWLQTVFGHDRISKRLPIGGDGSIEGQTCVKHAPPEQFRKFYRDHYRPELAAVIAVGDFSQPHIGGHSKVIHTLEKYLGPNEWPRTPANRFQRASPVQTTAPHVPPPLSDPSTSRSRFAESPRVLIQRDSELKWCSITMGVFMEHMPFAATPRSLKAHLVQDIWFEVLNTRLQKVVEDGGAESEFLHAHSSCDCFEGAHLAEFTCIAPEDAQWSAATLRLSLEVLRLCRFGVLPHELERVRGEYKTSLHSAWASRHDVESTDIVDRLVTHFLHDEATSIRCTDEYRYRLSLRLAELVTLDELKEMSDKMRGLLDDDGPTWVNVKLSSNETPCLGRHV